MTTDHNEAMRLAGELVAPIGTQTSYQTAHEAAALLRKQAADLKSARAETNRIIALLDAANDERKALRAEVERLRPNAMRYEFLRDDINSDWAICEWSHDEPDGIGYYRDGRAPDVVDAAIDRAIEAAKDAK